MRQVTQRISKLELDFLEEASRQFDEHPDIDHFRGLEFVAFRGYEDEVQVYRFDKHYPKVATFTGQIKQGKSRRKNK